jgi:hypothetical protein
MRKGNGGEHTFGFRRGDQSIHAATVFNGRGGAPIKIAGRTAATSAASRQDGSCNDEQCEQLIGKFPGTHSLYLLRLIFWIRRYRALLTRSLPDTSISVNKLLIF